MFILTVGSAGNYLGINSVVTHVMLTCNVINRNGNAPKDNYNNQSNSINSVAWNFYRYSGPSILRPPTGPGKCGLILQVVLK